MAYRKFTKKRTRKVKDYNDRMIDVVNSMLIDSRIGYTVPTAYYNDKTEKRNNG